MSNVCMCVLGVIPHGECVHAWGVNYWKIGACFWCYLKANVCVLGVLPIGECVCDWGDT